MGYQSWVYQVSQRPVVKEEKAADQRCSVTPLRANFMHASSIPFGEMKL